MRFYLSTIFGVGGVWLTIMLGFILLADLFASSFVFLFTGEFVSYIQRFVSGFSGDWSLLWQSNWMINTGLKGLDQIVNLWIGFQYSQIGRLILLGTLVGLFFAEAIYSHYFPFYGYTPKYDQDHWVMKVLAVISILLFSIPFTPLAIAFVWSYVMFFLESLDLIGKFLVGLTG